MSERTLEILRAVRAAAPSWRGSLRPTGRIDSPFAGVHRTARLGPGEDWAEARAYQPGDDVRRIDWSASARSGSVQVRDTFAERGMRITLVVDCSPSMQFGTDTLTKADLALATAAGVAALATRQGDSVAAMLVRPGDLRWVSPGSGVAHTNVLLRNLSRAFATEGAASFTEGLHRADGHTRSSGLFVAISDFYDEGVAFALRRLASRHRTVAVVVEDRRESTLVPAGLLEVYDPETEEYMLLDTDSPRFAERFATIAAARRAARDEMLGASGVEVRRLVCGPQWLADLGRMLAEVGS